MNVIQIGILGITGTLLAVFLKKEKAEFSIYVGIGISLIIFFGIVGNLKEIIRTIHRFTQMAEIDNTYILVLLKMIGIPYVSEFATGICKAAGYQTIAGQIEIFAKLTIFMLSLPILTALLQVIQGFML